MFLYIFHKLNETSNPKLEDILKLEIFEVLYISILNEKDYFGLYLIWLLRCLESSSIKIIITLKFNIYSINCSIWVIISIVLPSCVPAFLTFWCLIYFNLFSFSMTFKVFFHSTLLLSKHNSLSTVFSVAYLPVQFLMLFIL